jgi:hypothetical protein
VCENNIVSGNAGARRTRVTRSNSFFISILQASWLGSDDVVL